MRNYKDLEVWKSSVELAEIVYRLSEGFPWRERPELIDQLRVSVSSVGAHIALAAASSDTDESNHHMETADRSLGATGTLLLLAVHLRLADEDQVDDILNRAERLSRMLAGLTDSLPGEP